MLGSGSGSVGTNNEINYGSGCRSRRPKILRIRILNTGFHKADRTDLPQASEKMNYIFFFFLAILDLDLI
jgi:hypothetical protein